MTRYRTGAAWLLASVVVVGLGGGASRVRAQQPQPPSDDVDVVQLRPNFYMIAEAGGNIAVQLGPEGVILVDSGSTEMSDKVLAAIKRLTKQPIRYIINTNGDADHVGGNEKLSKSGLTILSGATGNAAFGEDVINNSGAASVLAHENVLARMSGRSGERPPFPSALWPTKVYLGKGYPMFLNGDGIQVLYAPAAHSDGDSVVFFRRADVIVAGDILDLGRFPVIDVEKGGSIQGEIDALNRIIDMIIPPFPLVWQEGRTYVVPGHGPVCDHADVVEYRDMVTIVRDVVQDLIASGKTLDQVKAADPTKGFRARFGSDSGAWTTDKFVEAVYRSLTANTGKKS